MTDYQKYINALRKCAKEHENDRTFTGHIIVSDLCKDTANLLEALGQEPKKGHWEWVQYDYNPKLGNWHCSECRCVVVECVDKNEKGGIPWYKYCPQCGAKMVEPQERRNK